MTRDTTDRQLRSWSRCLSKSVPSPDMLASVSATKTRSVARSQPTLMVSLRSLPSPLPSLRPSPLLSPPLPLEVRHPIAARGSGGALKLPQWVRAEPGRQTVFGELYAKNRACSSNGLEEVYETYQYMIDCKKRNTLPCTSITTNHLHGTQKFQCRYG